MLFICASKKNICIFQSFIFQKNTKGHPNFFFLAILRWYQSHFLDCPFGYVQNAGHIPGTGQITPDYPTTSYSSTIEDCSNRCNALPNCCSFEYSAYNYLCYMNILCQPTQSAYIDFSFCTKEPGMFKNYQIFSLNQSYIYQVL